MITTPSEIMIIGAGGHAKVVASIAQDAFKVLGCMDLDPAENATLAGFPVLRENTSDYRHCGVVVAIGDNRRRLNVAERFSGHTFVVVADRRSAIANNMNVGVGSQILYNTVIEPGVEIGKHAIINSGATVAHDCRIGDFVHIGPGAHLAWNVSVGDGTFVGIGASIIGGITIGRWCIIGAGAAVLRDIPDYSVAFGVPARVHRQNKVALQ